MYIYFVLERELLSRTCVGLDGGLPYKLARFSNYRQFNFTTLVDNYKNANSWLVFDNRCIIVLTYSHGIMNIDNKGNTVAAAAAATCCNCRWLCYLLAKCVVQVSFLKHRSLRKLSKSCNCKFYCIVDLDFGLTVQDFNFKELLSEDNRRRIIAIKRSRKDAIVALLTLW